MSRWNHAMCESCWSERNPDRVPVQVQGDDIEHCCYCGRHTQSGIYVRDDPNGIKGHVPHREDAA